MEAFATYEDLEAGWPDHPELDEDAATTLLARASAQLSSLLAAHNVEVDPDDEVQAMNLCSVACAMVRRSMSQPAGGGIASMSQAIGSTSASVTFSNPDGSFYLSRQDKELLGIIGGGVVRQVRAAIHEPDGSPVEGW